MKIHCVKKDDLATPNFEFFQIFFSRSRSLSGVGLPSLASLPVCVWSLRMLRTSSVVRAAARAVAVATRECAAPSCAKSSNSHF